MSYDINEAFLAGTSYKLGDANKGQTITGPNGSQWFVVDTRDTATGYQGALLKNVTTGKYELVSRGTEFDREPIKDGVADLQMGLGQLPDQVADARAFLKNSQDYITEKGGNPNSDLSLTGHSLGGSITQVLGAENPQLRATAFNPYGTGNLIPEGGSHPNVTNHVTSSDSVSTMPGSNMVGETLRYESSGGHGIGQFVDVSLANQSGVHVTINMPPVQGIDSDPMGTGDGAAIMNVANGASPSEPEIPEIVITAPREVHTLGNYLNTQGTSLTPAQQETLATQIDKLGLGGEADLSFYSLPGGGTLIANADGDIVGEINLSDAGDLNLRATAIDAEGNAVQVSQHISESGQSLTDAQYSQQQLTQLSAGLGLVNNFQSLQNWNDLSDLSRLSTLVGTYNNLSNLSGGASGFLGDLGPLAGGLGLIAALDSGDGLGIVSSVNVLTDSAVDGAINSALGSSGIPYLSIVTSLANFEDNPAQSIGSLVGMYFGGPIGAAIGGLIGGMLGGLFGDDDPPPPPVGQVHFAFNAAGQIEVVIDQDQSGGGQAAKGTANSILSGILGQLNQANDPEHPEMALTLNPFALPKLGYNWGGYYLECTDLNGVSYTMRPGNEQLGASFLHHVQINHAVIPQWQAQTLQEHYEQTGIVPTVSSQALTIQTDIDSIKLAAATALQDQAIELDGQVAQFDQQTMALQKEVMTLEQIMRRKPSDETAQALQEKSDLIAGIKAQVAELRQEASELHAQASHDLAYAANQQTYRVLTVQVQDPVALGSATVLRDVDGDGYLEQTQWVQKNQAILGIDLNGDGVLGSNSEFLNLDSGNSFNSASWLDANHDGVLNASDPAFAVLKLWVSASSESLGNVKPADMETMGQAHIVSINLRTGQVQYADGSSNALTEQTLRADVKGVKAQQQVGGLAVDNEDGEKLLYAINTNEFNGQTAHIHQDEALVFQGATAVKTAKETGTQSNANVANTQLSNGGAGTATSGQTAGSQATQAAQVAQVRSAVGLGFVPSGESSAQNELRQVTDAMIQSADSALFGGLSNSGGGATLGALGLVAGGMGVQMPALASETQSLVSNTGVTSFTSGANPTVVPVFTNTSGSTNSGTSQSLPTAYVNASPTIFQSDPLARTPMATSPTISAAVTTSFTSDLAPAAPIVQNTGASSSPAIIKNTSPTSAAAQPVTTSGVGNVVAESSTTAPVLVAPSLQGETLAGTEDVVLRIPSSSLLANDTTANAAADANRPLLSITAVANPTHGQVGLNNGDVVFIPDANFHGTATFTYTVVDQYGLQSTATATLEIAAVNDAPATIDQSGATNEDNIVYFNVADLLSKATDADTSTDGQTLSISGIVSSGHGIATLTNDGRIKFVPDANFHGAANFVYMVSDGNGGDTPAKVFVQVTSVNDVPVATGEIGSTIEDTAIVFTQAQLLANDTDNDIVIDGQVLSISAVSGAVNGAVTLLPNGDVRFAPDANYHGSAQFSYTVTDSNGGTAIADVNLTVLCVNDAPVAVGDFLNLMEDASITITPSQLLGNDKDVDSTTDGDVISISRVFSAEHCTVTLNANGTVSFLAEANFHGNARFSYEVMDSQGATSTTTVVAKVNAVNDAPIANSDTIESTEDTLCLVSTATLLANDADADLASDGDVISLSSVGNALHGAVRLLIDGNIEFTPDANFNGTAGFDYVVTDALGATGRAHVTITVGAVNDAPVVKTDATQTAEDTAIEWQSSQLLKNASDVDVATDGQVLSISSVTNSLHGFVSLDAGGKVTFTPNPNYHGAASFQYAVSDANGSVTLGTVSLDITALNDAPVTTDDTAATNEDTSIVLTQAELLANDSDVDTATDGQVLNITRVGNAQHGTVSLFTQADGTQAVRFTPDANYHGPAQFTYTVGDGSVAAGAGAETTANVTFTIAALNDAPVAVGDLISTQEDVTTVLTSPQLLVNDTDNDISTDGDALTITRVFDPQHCSVTLNADGSVSLTPDSNYHGNVRFTYEITDKQGATSTAFVVAGVSAANDTPVGHDDNFSSLEDEVLTLKSVDLVRNDTDNDIVSDGDVLHVAQVNNASHGQVRLLGNGQIEFIPDVNYHGIATFDYVVMDSFGAACVSTVSVNVGAVNDSPAVTNERVETAEDVVYFTTATELLSNVSDVDTITDGQVLHIDSVADALHGVVAMSPNGVITFIPDENFHGLASFTYLVNDGAGGVSTGKVTLDVLAVNDAPVPTDDTAATNEDTSIVLTQAELLANDSDVDTATDGQVLSITRVGNAQHGTVSLFTQADGTQAVRFTPNADYHGTAQFTYTVGDGSVAEGAGAETTATVTLSIEAVNDVPVLVNDVVATNEDIALLIDAGTLLANDSDADTATDGQVLSIQAVSSITGQTHGTVSLITQADGSQQIQFTTDSNYHGIAKFNYTVSDGYGGTATAVAAVNIAALNDAPVTTNDTAATNEDTSIVLTQAELLANDSDVDTATDGQSLNITRVGNAQHGTVSLFTQADGTQAVRFTPDANYHGTAQFTYTVGDGNGGASDAVVNLNVRAVNDNPIATGDVLTGNGVGGTVGIEDTTISINAAILLANDTDADIATDGQTLNIASVFGATHGSVSLVTLNNGTQQINFTPDLNYNGPAQFSYTVTDGNGGMSTAVATLVVAPVNDLPVVQNETGSVDEDNTIYFTTQSLLANDTDVDTSTNAQTLSIDSVSAGTNGTVGFTSDGRIFFRPNDNYNGNASFTYTVSDGAGGLVDGQVQLTINPVNDAPVALGESISASEDEPLLISVSDLLVNDSDVDNAHSSLTVTAVANALHGTASLITQPDGSQRVLFTPEANYHGIASFEYTVADPDGLMSTATATIAIAAVNDTPVTANESAQTDEDVGLVFTQAQLFANDTDVDIATDGDSLHVSRVGLAMHGTVFIDTQGQIRFVPDANYHGAAQFTYWVADSFGAEAPAVVNVVVAPVNDVPVAISEETVTQEDTTLFIDPASLLVNDTDPDTVTDGQILSVSAVSNATHGSVTLLANGTIQFVPDTNFHGAASFDYTVSDGNGGTSVTTAVIRINAVNDAPVALGESATGDEDNELIFTSAALLVNDSDVDIATDGQVLSISRVGASSHGTVSLDAQGQVHFTPVANYHGAAQFTYWVSDSNGAETPAVVTLNIVAVNDLPVVNGEVVSGTEDVPLLFNPAQLLANDSDADVATDGQVLSISAVSNAQHGTVSIKANGQIEFLPDANFEGSASFDYTVSDGAGGSRVATTTINLAPVNDSPVVVGEVINSMEDVPLNSQASLLLANDSDIDNPASDLRIVSVGSATHGTISLNTDGSITFAPDLNYFGSASFVYTVSDGSGGFTAGTASLNVAPVNDAPLAVGESVSLDEDTIAHFSITSLLSNDSDVDNVHPDLAITGVSAAVGGAVQIVEGEIVFTPTLNFNGQASFQYSVADGVGGVTQATVSINFNPVNDAPVASDVNYDAKRNVAYTIPASTLLQQGLVDDIDSGAASVQLVGVTNAQHCSVSYNSTTGLVTVNPVAGYSGQATFDYVVQDPQGLQTTAHANINFIIANTAPIATDDSFVGDEDTSFVIAPAQLLSNDWDQDNVHSDLSVTSVANPHNGSVSFQNGSVVFTPNANFSGNADFQYQVSDGAGGSTWVTAYVTVNPVNDSPVITSTTNSLDPYTVYSGGYESGPPSASGSRRIGDVNAFDVEGDTVHFGIYAQPDHGYLTIDANTGHWIYSTTVTTQTGTSFTNITANIDTYYGGVDFSFYAEDSHGVRTISQTIHAEYHGTASTGVAQTIAPIVIDLCNDGLDLVNPSQSPFEYRSENAIEPARYGWVGANDGLLAFDQNHDRTINNLNEISFTGYLEGAKTDLEGLAAFDSNHDGVVNASDAKWSDFGVFQDKNQNGVCDAGEFISLAAANITQIDLQRTGESKVVAGNIVFGDATVHRTDGTTTTAGDVAFLRDDVQAPTHEAVQSFLQGQSPLTLAPAITAPSEISPDVHTVVSAATDNLDAVNAEDLAEYARIRQMANYFNQVVATAIADPSVESPALGYVDLSSVHHADMISSLINVKNAQSSFEAHS